MIVAEIEGLYSAYLRTRRSARRARLLAELGQAADRLAAEVRGTPAPAPLVPGPRRRRRRQLAVHRGAEWIIERFGRP